MNAHAIVVGSIALIRVLIQPRMSLGFQMIIFILAGALLLYGISYEENQEEKQKITRKKTNKIIYGKKNL